jgi:hypothetical protein
MGGSGVTQRVEIAYPFQRSFICFTKVSRILHIWLLLAALSTDMTIIPRTRKKISIPRPISPSLHGFFLYIRIPASAGEVFVPCSKTWSVCRQTVVPHFFCFQVTILPRSLSPFYFYHASVCGSRISPFFLVYRLRTLVLLRDVLLSIHI